MFSALSGVCQKGINKILESTISEIQSSLSFIFTATFCVSSENTHQSILGRKGQRVENLLTKLPTLSIDLKFSDILLCSSAMNKVFITMQRVMVRSIKGSFMKAATFFLILNQSGQQSQIRYFKAKSFRHGGHLRWDSSSSKNKRKPHCS